MLCGNRPGQAFLFGESLTHLRRIGRLVFLLDPVSHLAGCYFIIAEDLGVLWSKDVYRGWKGNGARSFKIKMPSLVLALAGWLEYAGNGGGDGDEADRRYVRGVGWVAVVNPSVSLRLTFEDESL